MNGFAEAGELRTGLARQDNYLLKKIKITGQAGVVPGCAR
jgi:hypothetical protein